MINEAFHSFHLGEYKPLNEVTTIGHRIRRMVELQDIVEGNPFYDICIEWCKDGMLKPLYVRKFIVEVDYMDIPVKILFKRGDGYIMYAGGLQIRNNGGSVSYMQRKMEFDKDFRKIFMAMARPVALKQSSNKLASKAEFNPTRHTQKSVVKYDNWKRDTYNRGHWDMMQPHEEVRFKALKQAHFNNTPFKRGY